LIDNKNDEDNINASNDNLWKLSKEQDSARIEWIELTHDNFWNNKDYFPNWNYNFPNIKFSYPKNWDKNVALDTDSFSWHHFYDKDKNISFSIKNHFISWCPVLYTRCNEDEIIDRKWNEKLNLLIDYYRSKSYIFENNYFLKWLNNYAFVSNDRTRYIFEVDWWVIEFWFTFKNNELDTNFIDLVMGRIYRDT
jgi:hypothetical protein